MNTDLKKLWARTAILLWPEELILASFNVTDGRKILGSEALCDGGLCAAILERDEVSVTCSRSSSERLSTEVTPKATAGPYRAITLDLSIDLGVHGYLAPAATRLAEAGIAIVPQCAFLKDHLVVQSGDVAKAVDVLQGLIDDAREGLPH